MKPLGHIVSEMYSRGIMVDGVDIGSKNKRRGVRRMGFYMVQSKVFGIIIFNHLQ